MSDHHAFTRDIFRELLEIDTTRETTTAARAMAARLAAAGIPAHDIVIDGPHPDKQNLVARLRGSGARKPILLLAHLDVVGVEREHWTVDPFALTENDGHYYGRGTSDDKAMAAIWIATLARLCAERATLDRDVIVALTADEEGGSHNGARWLANERRALVDAEFGLNEGGYGRLRDGLRLANQVQASEKTPEFFDVVASGTAGHSSLPGSDNAVVRLAKAIARLAVLEFPVEVSDVTREFFRRMASVEAGSVAADMRAFADDPHNTAAAQRLAAVPYFSGLIRTTCTPTAMSGGDGQNVIPATARGVVDCRLLPGATVEQVKSALDAAIDDPRVTVTPRFNLEPAPSSPLRPDLLRTVEEITESLWPGVPVIPVMSIGATDSAHFRRAGIPMYGISGLFLDVNDTRAHGHDERILVGSFHESAEFLYRLVYSVAVFAAGIDA
jgi:acetylornithine deacetylase/succinyl-diaminopimelate desuccinylase-like protein